MKVYNTVKRLLIEQPELRDSDKALAWEVWKKQGVIFTAPSGAQIMTFDSFKKAKSTETIRRTRQKIQETIPALRASQPVQEQKNNKQNQKGTFIFRETL